MMKIALIGRPNVGKSTLFNRLVGRKLAIVHDKPGVTRDRKEAPAKLRDMNLVIIDTAGYEDTKEETIEKRMWEQSKCAIDESDVCIFMIDARDGVQPYDKLLANLLRQSGKEIILLANKCEGREQENSIFEAYSLGVGDPVPFSAEHALGMNFLYDLLKPIYKKLHAETEAKEKKELEEKTKKIELSEDVTMDEDGFIDDGFDETRPIKIAIVGRPNVGKSTLVNALIKDDRMLTGPEAGITRDAITVPWSWEGREISLVDTAGLRKQARVTDSLERMSVASTKYATNMAQVVILVLDADGVLDKQELTIARKVIEEGRALIIAINKWDIANRNEVLEVLNYKLRNSLAQADGIPTVTISALKNEGFDKLMSAVFKVYKAWNLRIPTAPLNQWFAGMLERNAPPLGKNKRRIKLRYITQMKTRPPSFYISSSNPEGLPDSYKRYITNGLRDTFGLWGTPIRIMVRKTGNPYAENK